jgi:outer membrane receptor protein involved in Fe transport
MFRPRSVALALSLAALLPVCALAANAPDTTFGRVVFQDTVVVTASKIGLRLSDFATTATVISPREIRLGTSTSVQNVLAPVPGAHVLDMNGTETNGSVEARGFAAQGTTSPMVVLVDEIPTNDFETGKVDWGLLSQSQVDHVEFMRGPASFLYGTASMAGLVNVVTLAPGQSGSLWGQASGGSVGRADLAAGGTWNTRKNQGSISGSWQRLDGFRDNSESRVASGYGFTKFDFADHWSFRARLLAHQGQEQVPGPLPNPDWQTDPSKSITPTDDRNDHTYDGAIEVTGDPSRKLNVVLLASGTSENADATETILPTSALDRSSDLHYSRTEARVHWTPGSHGSPDVLFGGEYRFGVLKSRYHDPASGALVGAGNVDRTSGAVFALGRVPFLERFTLVGGGRVDWLRSSLDDPTDGAPRFPDDDQRAISPTAGVNAALPGGGHAWVSYSGAFKAPELDQLYDQRPYDLGFGTFHISSNVLKPQTGDHWDAGARAFLGRGLWLDAAGYYIRSRDEIGFDLANFRLNNIARSKHLGVETQLSMEPVHGISGMVSYAWTGAKFDGGPHDGKQINTVPENQIFSRVTYEHRWHGTVSAEVSGATRQWIDEDNQYPLPDYALLNLGATQTAGQVELFASLRNVADRRYASLGYVTLDQYGNNLPLYFPASGRSFLAGVRMRLAAR